MTGPRDRHVEFEELISASLQGDLSVEERRYLDAHLDGCDACRATLAAFSDQRRIMAGLRHVAPPRDLHARVRTGVERGRFASLPWWRRPATIFAGVGGGLAVVAGALLAIVLLGDPDPQVGDATPSPSVSASVVATPSPDASFPAGPTPTASPDTSVAPEPTAEPTASPEPTPTPSPEPDVYLALTGPLDNRALLVRDGDNELLYEIDTPLGPPITAELSPDGQWIAYVTRVGESGLHEVRATRISAGMPSDDPDALPPAESVFAVGETVVLGESISGEPFVERLFWSSPRSLYLAYTLTDPDSGETDVWVFEPAYEEPYRLTDTGSAYAASWIPGSAGSSLLWVSEAGERPTSHLRYFHDDAMAPEDRSPGDPAVEAMASVEGVFQPILSPNGRFAIYWDGAMEQSGDAWAFATGGQPYLADHLVDSEEFGFTSERPVFTDLTVGRDGFRSASVTWSLDSVAYAVWGTAWTGPSQSGAGQDPYPDESRIYFSRATDERGMTRIHALDRDDIPEGWSVVDVKVAPTGEHLLVTVLRPIGGTLEAPVAELLLIERNTGDEADEVETLASSDSGWFGPGAFAPGWEAADRP